MARPVLWKEPHILSLAKEAAAEQTALPMRGGFDPQAPITLSTCPACGSKQHSSPTPTAAPFPWLSVAWYDTLFSPKRKAGSVRGRELSLSSAPQVLMLRRCLTWLRATWVAKVLPLDQNVVFHQLVGYVVAALATVHTGAHVGNFGECRASALPWVLTPLHYKYSSERRHASHGGAGALV